MAGLRRCNNERRKGMTCKSCQTRKIRCCRTRPKCEACQSFGCLCIYDGVLQKREPKRDVLECLSRRVDELENRLEGERVQMGNRSASNPNQSRESSAPSEYSVHSSNVQQSSIFNTTTDQGSSGSDVRSNSTPVSNSWLSVLPEALLDVFFARAQWTTFYILDDTTMRQRLCSNLVPRYLLYAVYAVSARYTTYPEGFYEAVRASEYYAMQARNEIDTDEPSLYALQALILLAIAFLAAGNGKKSYMLLSSAIGMAMALGLAKELDYKVKVAPVERELRRKLFWTVYLMDRFMSCGSKRPCLILDDCITLRLPTWPSSSMALPFSDELFQHELGHQCSAEMKMKSRNSSGMLIDIVRILDVANRYLAAGGVKGDSHFPWHSQSTLSKIRQDLDKWESWTQEFESIDGLLAQSNNMTLVLSKLIYHSIHCLIYRPFLPIDIAELTGTAHQKSWQIEVLTSCFLHANAIAALVELGKQSGSVEWPSFVGYCICTAGTVHVHGIYYKDVSEGKVYSTSAELLSREMQQLADLRDTWHSVRHQCETIQTIYDCHSRLAEVFKSNSRSHYRVSPSQDFFDRYSFFSDSIDGAYISFADVIPRSTNESHIGRVLHAPGMAIKSVQSAEPGTRTSSIKPAFSSCGQNDLNAGTYGCGTSDGHDLVSQESNHAKAPQGPISISAELQPLPPCSDISDPFPTLYTRRVGPQSFYDIPAVQQHSLLTIESFVGAERH